MIHKKSSRKPSTMPALLLAGNVLIQRGNISQLMTFTVSDSP